jgi:peptidoglycan/LPS O-acetylase OafA/YrhL
MTAPPLSLPRDSRRLEVGYRRDVDGLRGLAVLAVIGYHAVPRWIRGGFIGVDIFFVLSGYLITGLILTSLHNRTFSYRNFFARRVRRIFPALIVTLLACLALGRLAFLPDEFASLGAQSAAAAGFVANLFFWRDSGYFNAASDTKPLLHLWSLGVEEQFYLVWPFVVALLYQSWRRRLPLAIGIIGLASFALNVVMVTNHPSATFYLPMTRLWELVAGALIVMAELRHVEPPVSTERQRFGSEALAWNGISLLALGLLFIDGTRAFPGWWALIPTLGTCSLLAAGVGARVNRTILGGRSLVAIGIISYPLYLWHWPLLSFSRIVYGPLSTGAALALLCIAALLASLTYLLVERPIRFGARPTVVVPVLCSAMGVAMAVAAGVADGRLSARSSGAGLERILQATGDWSADLHLKPIQLAHAVIYSAGPDAADHALFFGDSNLEQFMPRIVDLIGRDADRYQSAFVATANGCPPIPDVHESGHPGCAEFVREVLQFSSTHTVTTTVVGACWYCYFVTEGRPESQYTYYFERDGVRTPLNDRVAGDRRTFVTLRDMLSGFAASSRTYLVLNIPSGRALDPKYMVQRSLFRGFTVNAGGLDRNAFLTDYGPVRNQLLEIAQAAGVAVIDPMQWLCNDTTCPAVSTDGDPLYKDASHLRASYVRAHVHFLDNVLARP